MLPSASAMAAVVEMIIVPCLPGMRPEECGLKVRVTGGTATLTTAAGGVIKGAPGRPAQPVAAAVVAKRLRSRAEVAVVAELLRVEVLDQAGAQALAEVEA